MTSENDVPKFLRFCDLQDRGLVQSHAGLRHLQVHEGFPLGRLLGPSTRVWTVTEINGWLNSRPVASQAHDLTGRRTARTSVRHFQMSWKALC